MSEKDQAAERVKMELRKLKANFLASHPEGHTELTTVFADIAAPGRARLGWRRLLKAAGRKPYSLHRTTLDDALEDGLLVCFPNTEHRRAFTLMGLWNRVSLATLKVQDGCGFGQESPLRSTLRL